MGVRTNLHQILCDILASFGVWLWNPFDFEEDTVDDVIMEGAKKHVYFQPPENMLLEYPCIVYRGDGGDTQFADNAPYIRKRRYQITVMDENPDSPIPDKVAALPLCTYDRDYTADNLNHFVFNIYY